MLLNYAVKIIRDINLHVNERGQYINKMSRITGTLEIDFETGKIITQEQYDKFERTLNKMVEDWEMMVYDAAERSGFDADEIHPILLDNLDCDFDDE